MTFPSATVCSKALLPPSVRTNSELQLKEGLQRLLSHLLLTQTAKTGMMMRRIRIVQKIMSMVMLSIMIDDTDRAKSHDDNYDYDYDELFSHDRQQHSRHPRACIVTCRAQTSG